MVRPLIKVVGQELLYDPDGTSVSLTFKVEFPCSNNETEYEALLVWLVSTLHMDIQRF